MCEGDCEYDKVFLQDMYKLISEVVTNESETFYRNFIRRAVHDKVMEMKQGPCDTCPYNK